MTMRQIQSTITEAGELVLALADVPEPAPGPGEIKLRIEAAPINPSDIGLLTGAADMRTVVAEENAIRVSVPPAGLRAMAPLFRAALRDGPAQRACIRTGHGPDWIRRGFSAQDGARS